MKNIVGKGKKCTKSLFPQNCVDSLPNNKIATRTKLKVFVNCKINVVKIFISVFDWKENMGKGENAGNRHLLLFTHHFQKLSIPGLLKVGTVRQEVKTLYKTINYRLVQIKSICR